MTETQRKVCALYMIFAVTAIASAVDLAGLLSHHAGAHAAAAVAICCAGVLGMGASAVGIRMQKRRPDQDAIARMEREISESAARGEH